MHLGKHESTLPLPTALHRVGAGVAQSPRCGSDVWPALVAEDSRVATAFLWGGCGKNLPSPTREREGWESAGTWAGGGLRLSTNVKGAFISPGTKSRHPSYTQKFMSARERGAAGIDQSRLCPTPTQPQRLLLEA